MSKTPYEVGYEDGKAAVGRDNTMPAERGVAAGRADRRGSRSQGSRLGPTAWKRGKLAPILRCGCDSVTFIARRADDGIEVVCHYCGAQFPIARVLAVLQEG